VSFARAASGLPGLLFPVLDRVENLHEGGAGRLARIGVGGLPNGALGVEPIARAALVRIIGIWFCTGRPFALQLALGPSAVGGLGAFVGAFQLFAHGAASGLGGRAGSVALGRGAHRLALGAVFLLAEVLGATNGASRALAVNGAFGARNLFAFHFASGSCADGMADSRAGGVIALPSALGVALCCGHNPKEASAQKENTQ